EGVSHGQNLATKAASRLRWWRRRRGEDFEFDAHADPREGRIDRHDGDLVVVGAGVEPGGIEGEEQRAGRAAARVAEPQPGDVDGVIRIPRLGPVPAYRRDEEPRDVWRGACGRR